MGQSPSRQQEAWLHTWTSIMEQCLTRKASSQGHIWHPVWHTAMGNQPQGWAAGKPTMLLFPKVPHHFQCPNWTDPTSTVRTYLRDLKKIQNTQPWRTGLVELKTPWFYKWMYYKISHLLIFWFISSILLHFMAHFIDNTVHFQWRSQKFLGTVPLYKLHFPLFQILH